MRKSGSDSLVCGWQEDLTSATEKELTSYRREQKVRPAELRTDGKGSPSHRLGS